MAHFAKLDENNVILSVVVVNNDVLQNLEFPQSEQLGANFLINTLKLNFVWKQTSYNGNFRKNYAGPGYTYDATRDAFIPPKPYPSWILDEQTCLWGSPVPLPNDGGLYNWNESNQTWDAAE